MVEKPNGKLVLVTYLPASPDKLPWTKFVREDKYWSAQGRSMGWLQTHNPRCLACAKNSPVNFVINKWVEDLTNGGEFIRGDVLYFHPDDKENCAPQASRKRSFRRSAKRRRVKHRPPIG